MARLIFIMNQSLDGYVDHDRFAPDAVLFRHFIDMVRGQTDAVYGRHLYDLMRYWDVDQPEWSEAEREFARVWRGLHKWVVSTTLTEVGPNATLISGDVEAALRALKARVPGDIEVGGTVLAHRLGQLGLVDEYHIYLHPVVLGTGKPFFAGPLPPLRLTGTERIGESVIKLSYVPG